VAEPQDLAGRFTNPIEVGQLGPSPPTAELAEQELVSTADALASYSLDGALAETKLDGSVSPTEAFASGSPAQMDRHLKMRGGLNMEPCRRFARHQGLFHYRSW
jgi:hypothetical protein